LAIADSFLNPTLLYPNENSKITNLKSLKAGKIKGIFFKENRCEICRVNKKYGFII
jgi:hypothetical protein